MGLTSSFHFADLSTEHRGARKARASRSDGALRAPHTPAFGDSFGKLKVSHKTPVSCLFLKISDSW